MPFVQFENSIGRGWVVPDGLGGTKLDYFFLNSSDPVLKGVDQLSDQAQVVVEPVLGSRVAGRDE